MPPKDPAAHKAARKLENQRYSEKHREEKAARDRAYYLAHKDEIRQKREADPEKYRARDRASYAAHRGARLEGMQAWKAAHADHVLAKSREYEVTHREERHLKDQIYNASEAGRARKRTYNDAHREELRAKDRERYQANIEELRAKKRDYMRAHIDERRVYSQEYNATHSESIRLKQKVYRAKATPAMKEKKREGGRRYYHANKDTLLPKQHESYIAHKEERRAKNEAYRKTHPHIWTTAAKRRRAAKLQAPINDFTHEQWILLQATFRHCCAYCGKPAKGHLTQDHIQPLSQGGSHTLSNIVPACRPCNSKKGVKGPLIPIQPLLL